MATPEQNRDAWLALHQQVKASLLSVRENAKVSLANTRAIVADTDHQPRVTAQDWEATIWACDRLMRDLDGIRVPILPKAPDPEQTTVEEQIAQADADADRAPLRPVTQNTQAVEKPVDDGVVHYGERPELEQSMGPRQCPMFRRHPAGYWRAKSGSLYHCAGM